MTACDLVALGLCFTRPPQDSSSIFGFAEFLAAVALLVLVFNSSDPLYKFRVAVAPIPLIPLTFGCIGVIGVGALINDLWFAQRWLAPSLGISKAEIQAILGALFLTVVLAWTWFAFVRPPIFGPANAKAYFSTLYWTIVRGSDQQLSVVAAELAYSGPSLVRYASGGGMPRPRRWPRWILRRLWPLLFRLRERQRRKPVARIANDTLQLIANRKFCRHIIEASPVTAILIMQHAVKAGALNLPLHQFSTILNTEAIRFPDSILYHEDGLYTGALGSIQPFTKAVYGNFELVDSINGLDIDYRLIFSFTPAQLEAYCAIVTTTIKDYAKNGSLERRSTAIFRALSNIKSAVRDVHKLDGREDYYPDPAYERLRIACEFVKELVDLFDKTENLNLGPLRSKGRYQGSMLDHLAELALYLIEVASDVTKPQWTAWEVQHNTVWSAFGRFSQGGRAWNAFDYKLRRLAYEQIAEFDKWPNYQSARVLGFFLNVLGLEPIERKSRRGSQAALQKYVLTWTRRNYLRLRDEYPEVAEACLRGSISFDEKGRRLVKSFRPTMKGDIPQHFHDLQAVPATGAGATSPVPSRPRTRTTSKASTSKRSPPKKG